MQMVKRASSIQSIALIMIMYVANLRRLDFVLLLLMAKLLQKSERCMCQSSVLVKLILFAMSIYLAKALTALISNLFSWQDLHFRWLCIFNR